MTDQENISTFSSSAPDTMAEDRKSEKNSEVNSSSAADKKEESPLTRKVRYATYNMRMLAAIIDVLPIMLIIGFPISQLLDNYLYAPMNMREFLVIFADPHTPEELNRQLWKTLVDQHIIERNIITSILQIITLALYILPCWLHYNTTPGKWFAGIEMVDANSYGPLTREQKFKRFFAYLVSGIPFTLGFVWILFNKKRQGWHDKIAQTVVLRKEKKVKNLA